MKIILSFLGVITLIGTSTASLVACNTSEYTTEKLAKLKKENKIKTTDDNIKKNLEWIILPQESPFNNVDNKYYFVIWRGDVNHDWRIIKFKHSNHQKQIDKYDNYLLVSSDDEKNLFNLFILKGIASYFWIKFDNRTRFKSVYRWNGQDEPKIPIIDPKTGEIIDWKEVKEDK